MDGGLTMAIADQFLQYAQLRNQNNQALGNDIAGAVEMYQLMQAKKQANLEAARKAEEAKKQAALEPEAILAKANQFGVQALTPEEKAAFQAYNQIQSAKVTIDPLTKEAYSPYRAIELGGASAVMFPPTVKAEELPAPQAGGFEMLAPPPAEGNKATADEYFKEAPSPMGYKDEKPKKYEVPASENPMAGTKAGTMARYEKELQFYSEKLLKDYDKGLEKEAEAKSKNLVDTVLSRMSQINEELNKAGVIVSAERGTADNAKAMARGLTIPMPFTDGIKVGGTGEKALDPKNKALREEYERLRSTLLPFYAKASGLGAKSLDSNAERASMLDSFGDPNGTYEANKRQLENLSGIIGTGKVKAVENTDKTDKPEPSKTIKEGATATNPKTGEKMIYMGGKWTKQ